MTPNRHPRRGRTRKIALGLALAIGANLAATTAASAAESAKWTPPIEEAGVRWQ